VHELSAVVLNLLEARPFSSLRLPVGNVVAKLGTDRQTLLGGFQQIADDLRAHGWKARYDKERDRLAFDSERPRRVLPVAPPAPAPPPDPAAEARKLVEQAQAAGLVR
jgi:hypothetical protein